MSAGIVFHDDVRRDVAAITEGLARLMILVQSAHDDVAGAVSAGQVGLGAIQARQAALGCASVISLRHGGELWGVGDSVSFDALHGVSGTTRAMVDAVLNAAAEVETDTLVELGAMVDELVEHTAAMFDLDVPTLRSPDGLFAVMRIVREMAPLVEQLDLPGMIPAEWLG